MIGVDVLCQAKSGMGKTAVFVLTILHQLGEDPAPVSGLILCHTRELAYQIKNEFQRFVKYLPNIRVEVMFGGQPISEHMKILQSDKAPHIIVGTPGRILALTKKSELKFENLKMFVLDECDRMLEETGTPLQLTRFRYEVGRADHLQSHSPQKAGDDVLRHHEERGEINLPKVHERPVRSLH